METIQNIKGIYSFEITIPTMFHNYKITITNHNLITELGENYFIERWINNNYGLINKIVVGTGTTSVTKKDIKLGNQTQEFDITTYNINSSLRLHTEQEGSLINGISEIGVMTDDNRLISHDVFQQITIPTNCQVKLTYEFILTQNQGEN